MKPREKRARERYEVPPVDSDPIELDKGFEAYTRDLYREPPEKDAEPEGGESR